MYESNFYSGTLIRWCNILSLTTFCATFEEIFFILSAKVLAYL